MESAEEADYEPLQTGEPLQTSCTEVSSDPDLDVLISLAVSSATMIRSHTSKHWPAGCLCVLDGCWVS